MMAKTRKYHRFLFPEGMLPLWALFQAGLVFQNINYKLYILSLSAPASSGCGPELAAAGTLVSD